MIDGQAMDMQTYKDIDSVDLEMLNFDPSDNTTAAMGDIISEFGIGQLVLTLTLGLLILATVVGNILILFAIAAHRALRSPQKYLIASLNISDLMVALVVMPISLVHEVTGTWIFGVTLCHFWLSMDILSCTASILNLCVISLDRYWSITSPVKYSGKRTTKRILIYIIAVWLLALIISFAPFVGWLSNSDLSHQICFISQNLYYTVFSTFGAFFIPAAIILIVYYQIFAQAKKSIRKNLPAKDSPIHVSLDLNQQETSFSSLPASPNPAAMSNNIRTTHRSQTQIPTSAPDLNSNKHDGRAAAAKKLSTGQLGVQFTTKDTGKVIHNKQKRHSLGPISRTYSFSSQLLEERLRQKHALAAAREKRATRSVSIVTGCFLICWLPFFLMALILPLCGDSCHLPKVWKSIFLWLGYINSVLNPIIYTVFNKDFKEAFKKMFCRKQKHIIQGKLSPKKV